MKPLFKLVLPSILATSAIFSSAVSAAPVTITATAPTWSNPVGGTNITYNTSGFGFGTYTNVRWGNSTGEGQSGLGFDPFDPPQSTYQTDTVFQLGNLRHYNNPIASGTAASAVDLALLTSVQGAAPVQQAFAFRFFIDETPNSTPCSYPSSTPCADLITFSNLDLTSFFTLAGVNYTMELLGFSNNGSNFSSSFVSQEGGTNTIGLYAKITAAQVPEPGSIALLGLGLAGLAAASRRKQKTA